MNIVGQTKEGFWCIGFFIVPVENRAYYRDNEGTWRYLPLPDSTQN